MNVHIEKIEIASFGKLKNAVIDCKTGINILKAPNETGKTTVASFIKFIFYGFAGTKVHSVIGNEKKLYTPWDGEMSGGALNIVCDGKKYRIERSYYNSGREECTVTDISTGKQVLFDEVPGQHFFGVSEEVFSRTLFFCQLTVPTEKDELLGEQLKNIAISASEQVSTEKAKDRLKDAKNELRGRLGNGALPKAEKERDRILDEINDSSEIGKETDALYGEEVSLRRLVRESSSHLDTLNAEYRGIEKYDAYTRLSAIKDISEKEKAAKASYEHAMEGFKNPDENAVSKLFSKSSDYNAEIKRRERITEQLNLKQAESNELSDKYSFDEQTADSAKKSFDKSKKLSKIFGIAAAVCLVVGLIAFFIPEGRLFAVITLVAAALMFAVAAVFLAKPLALAKSLAFPSVSAMSEVLDSYGEDAEKISALRDETDSLKTELDECAVNITNLSSELDAGIGEFISVSGNTDYEHKLSDILAKAKKTGELKAAWEASKDALDNALRDVDIEMLSEEAKGAEKPERTKQKVEQEIKFYSQQNRINSDKLEDLIARRAELEGRRQDPSVLAGKKKALESFIEEGEKNFKALETAIDFITESSDYMKEMVAPRISERADEYFTLATDGKYENFGIDTKLSMYFGNDFRRSCDYLSAGTRDSAYLCLRLALADMLFGGNYVPMILDDAFVRIDSERLVSMMKAVASASQRHQIFIFTHSGREKDSLAVNGITSSDLIIKQV